MRTLPVWLFCLALACLSGCGSSEPTLYSVTGTLTYKGKPVPKASINIMPEQGAAATAMTDDNGSFVAQTNGKLGVVEGKAKVMVSLVTMIGAPETNDGSPEAAAKFSQLVNSGKIRFVSSVPAKYGQPTTTPLEITVTEEASEKTYDLELTD